LPGHLAQSALYQGELDLHVAESRSIS
jgi:hypothetical protein